MKFDTFNFSRFWLFSCQYLAIYGAYSTVSVGKDVDLLVLLVASTPTDCNTYFLKPNKGDTNEDVYSIAQIQSSDETIKFNIMFLHAITGCDTISAFFNQGRASIYNRVEQKKCFGEAALIFDNPIAVSYTHLTLPTIYSV